MALVHMNTMFFLYLFIYFFPVWTIVNASFFPPEPDSDSVSISRRGIEEKLVEEYKNCNYFKQTKAELGGSLCSSFYPY